MSSAELPSPKTIKLDDVSNTGSSEMTDSHNNASIAAEATVETTRTTVSFSLLPGYIIYELCVISCDAARRRTRCDPREMDQFVLHMGW